jgi:hypothetical protein
MGPELSCVRLWTWVDSKYLWERQSSRENLLFKVVVRQPNIYRRDYLRIRIGPHGMGRFPPLIWYTGCPCQWVLVPHLRWGTFLLKSISLWSHGPSKQEASGHRISCKSLIVAVRYLPFLPQGSLLKERALHIFFEPMELTSQLSTSTVTIWRQTTSVLYRCS